MPIVTAYEQSGQTRPQVFAVRLRQHLRALLNEMAAEAGAPVDQQWEDEPYLGLRAFDLQHAPIFFGREQETGAVLEALQQQQRNGCAFVLLVTLNEAAAAQPVRRRGALEAVTGTPARKQLVEALTAARLLTSDRSEVFVAHEALLRVWPKAQDWIKTNRDLLRTRARMDASLLRWKAEDKHRDYLLPEGKPLADAQELQKQWRAELSAEQHDCIILHDITSSYFEGEYAASDIVEFGYNRDHKAGHEQIVIGLITTAEGCPVCVEVFPGNCQHLSSGKSGWPSPLELERIAATALKSRGTKHPASDELVGARVGKALAKTRMGKYANWQMRPGGILDWRFDDAKIAADQALDGCYVIKTTVGAEAMTKDQAVASYKGLSRVEQAFHNLKTVSLEMRPMDHKTDARIRAHVFLCMLAYSLADLSRRH